MNILLVFAVILLVHSVSGKSDFLSNIKPNSDAETQQNAANKVIERVLGERANYFSLEVDFKLPHNYFKIFKSNKSEVVKIQASSGVAACKGFNYYLKHFLKGQISWSDYQLNSIQTELPAAEVAVKSSSKIIYYQNVCTHSYSFSWWTFEDWRKHIDWIALSGITLTLAPFQEDIWTEVYKEYGLTQKEIDQHLSGPGFFAWQRMGNERGFGGILSENFIRVSADLQKQMIVALNELGISVALPAFGGHLPTAFRKLYPKINFTAVEQWNHFPSKYCCPLFLDPLNPLFKEIGEKFLRKITAKYGSNHIYFSDPFNEVQPKQAEAKYLAQVSAGIYSAMKAVDEKAVWLLQAWMFVKNPFWSDELIEGFLTSVPKGKMLVLDLQSEQHPQYVRTKSFYGHKYIWCMLHNFGGTLGMHGSIPILNSQILNASSMANSSMMGVGITPEGIHQNYVVYEFALEKAWSYKEVNPKRWLKKYALVRYGFKSTKIEQAWLLLFKSVYSFSSQENIRGKYTYCRRPSLKINTWKWYDEKFVKKALSRFLVAASEEPLVKQNALFLHDLVDLGRQYLQVCADQLYTNLVKSYKERDLQNFTQTANMFLDLLNDLNALLGTHKDFLLGSFLEKAKLLAKDDAERKILEYNARNQITLWGPSGQILDYATKQWHGVASDYYYPRWQLFFEQLQESLSNKIPFNQSTFNSLVLEKVEDPFTRANNVYRTEAAGDSIAVAQHIFNKWN